MVVGAPNISILKKKIDEKKVISFDVFDTLLFRNVHHPKDVFRILDMFAENRFGIHHFYQTRIDAEKQARLLSENGECTFDEIYDLLADGLGSFTKRIQDLELQTELLISTANPFMKSIFDYACKNGKNVLIISDMYLSSETIRLLLRKSGYSECEVYVSNEYRRNKRCGALFQLIKDKNDLNSEQWLHVGDNLVSDGEMPHALGIETYIYKNVSSYEKKEPRTLEERIYWGIQNNAKYNGMIPAPQSEIDKLYSNLLERIFAFCK